VSLPKLVDQHDANIARVARAAELIEEACEILSSKLDEIRRVHELAETEEKPQQDELVPSPEAVQFVESFEARAALLVAYAQRLGRLFDAERAHIARCVATRERAMSTVPLRSLERGDAMTRHAHDNERGPPAVYRAPTFPATLHGPPRPRHSTRRWNRRCVAS
jgi:hypothetical protein